MDSNKMTNIRTLFRTILSKLLT